MSTTKNPMKERLRNNYVEMIHAKEYYCKVLKVLKDENNRKGDNIEIGYLIRDMPNFKHLRNSSNKVRGILTRVCIGDYDTRKAYREILSMYKMLIETMMCFNEKQLFKD